MSKPYVRHGDTLKDELHFILNVLMLDWGLTVKDAVLNDPQLRLWEIAMKGKGDMAKETAILAILMAKEEYK